MSTRLEIIVLGDPTSRPDRMGFAMEAVAILLALADAAPSDASALCRAGMILVRAKQSDRAISLFQRAVERQPGNATAWFLLGEAANASDELELSARAFRKVTELRPELSVGFANLGVVERRLGALSTAIRAQREAVRLEPGLAAHHAALGATLHQARMIEEALPVHRRHAILKPSDPSALFNAAISMPLLGAREVGLVLMRRAAVLDPSSAGIWVRVARLGRRIGRAEARFSGLRRALVLDPAEPEALAAWASDRAGDYPGQEIWRLRLLAVTPDNFTNVGRLAEALLRAGKASLAWRYLASRLERADMSDAIEAGLVEDLLPLLRRAATAAGCDTELHKQFGEARTAYERWMASTEIYDDAAIKIEASNWLDPPIISLILPVYEPPLVYLEAAIASVEAQSYPHWQLCIADDASPSPEIHRALEAAAARDPRIRLVLRRENGHISTASNSALDLADGPWVGFLDHDDLLAPHALHFVAQEIVANADLDLIYSDEDKINATGRRFDPHFKPGWNPDLLLSQNYICHFAVYRRGLVERVGRLRVGLEGSQDHDLALRVTENSTPDRIRHIARILYHWRAIEGSTSLSGETKPYVIEATCRALQDSYDRACAPVNVRVSEIGWHSRRAMPEPKPLVSVIMPTRDRLDMLRRAVDGVLQGTNYDHLELIIVDNGSVEPETVAYLKHLQATGGARVLPRPGPFNFSALSNDGAGAANGELLCFLNNDIEPLTPDWLYEMASHAVRPEIGVVGAKLLYPDGTVQHGGVILCGENVARHLYVGHPDASAGYWGRANQVQALSAVTGACMVVRRAAFEAVGGFDAEDLRIDFSDIDLCLRMAAAGWRTLWTPYARLTHHESASRGTFATVHKSAEWERERQVMRARWGSVLDEDPFYSPNFAYGPDDEPFSLAFPPRQS